MNIRIWKPRREFLGLALTILVIQLITGPIEWRHVDDWGVNGLYDSYINPLNLGAIKQLIAGWGTYPPSWNGQAFLGSLFGSQITLERYFLIMVGWISSVIIAIGTYSVSINALTRNGKNVQGKEIKAIINIAQSLSILLTGLNMEIFAHASSNMPYQLPALSTIGALLIAEASGVIPNRGIEAEEVWWNIRISGKNPAVAFMIASILISLGFQTILLIIPLAVVVIKTWRERKAKDNFDENTRRKHSINELVNKVRNQTPKDIIFIGIGLIYLLPWARKCLWLLLNGGSTGSWSLGIDNVYDLSLKNQNLWVIAEKIPYNISKIVGLSIYSGRQIQDEISIAIAVIIGITLIICRVSENRSLSLFVSIFSIELFLLAVTGKAPLTPTRHIIYAFPILWIIAINAAVNLYNLIIKFKAQNIVGGALMALFAIKVSVFYDAHKTINYQKSDILNVAELAKEADYYPWTSPMAEKGNSVIDNFSEFAYASTENMKIAKEKACRKEPAEKEYTIFAYSHRYSLKNEEGIITNEKSSKCIKRGSTYKIRRKVEIENSFDIEQDNNIDNGGSNMYAYLIKIRKEESEPG